MKVLRADTWKRRGCSLLWDAQQLAACTASDEVVSMRQFFSMAKNWPEELPSNNGQTLVVVGLEGCLDALSPDSAATWLSRDLLDVISGFRQEYELDAGLIFWLPSGRPRVRYSLAVDQYSWERRRDDLLPLGRLLWAGGQADAERIVVGQRNTDPDGPGYVGLYHPKIGS